MGREAVRRIRRVGLALEGLVESAGAVGDDRYSDEGLQKAGVERADSALEAAEIEAGAGRDDDHCGDAELEERGVVGEQGVGLRGRKDIIGCRGGGHSIRITRLELRDGSPSRYSADSPCLASSAAACLA